ncbi:hypothetical protein MASR2M78_33130 [Treponema sp.]
MLAPSNFERMAAHWSYAELSQIITGAYVDDEDTKATIERVYESSGYILDPHSAVAWSAIDALEAGEGRLAPLRAILSTAHPAKFGETVEPLIGKVPVPPSLATAMERSVDAQTIPANFDALSQALRELFQE